VSSISAIRPSVATIGRVFLYELKKLSDVMAVALAVLSHSCRRSTWTRTVRSALATQIVVSGASAMRFTAGVAFLAGLLIVVQAQFWFHRVGTSRFLGPLLVAVIIRELGPLLANLIVIGRSGSGTAVELAHMNVTREVHALDALGLDPFIYLVLPRVLGICIAIFCLSVLVIVVALLGGYISAAVLGVGAGTLRDFLAAVARSIHSQDVVNLLLKALIPGLFAGVICCTEGLAAESAEEISAASTRGVQRSLGMLFLITSVVSVFTYL
jgi:phospholipid/cholesterol/gamma-HCH transport system permease protein